VVNKTRVDEVVDVIELEVFYDYNCPFVFRASRMLDAVARSGERDVRVGWRYFSLAQVNHRSDDPDDGWTVWDAPESEPVRGRLAFKAAEAARRQDRFDALHHGLLAARHVERRDIDSFDVVEEVAGAAGLDLAWFRRDLADPEILRRLARDHTEGRDVHGVFGTPTLVLREGAAYLRLARELDEADAGRVFDRVIDTIALEPEVLEIKRPVRPSPG
jgi:predicted DsbA family dithiol-disulfide isomerase